MSKKRDWSLEGGLARPGGAGMINGIAPGYTPTARAWHWITAVLVLIMAPIGIAMANADFGGAQDTLYHVHRSIGMLLLPIMLLRLLYRLRHPPPPLPADMPAVQQVAAHANHWALYILLIVQPFIGWIATSAYRAPILFFWLFEVPPIWPVDQAFSERMFALHRWIGIAIALLVCIHIAAALYHHFIRKDRVLMRMVSG
jgi:cytochrome b561